MGPYPLVQGIIPRSQRIRVHFCTVFWGVFECSLSIGRSTPCIWSAFGRFGQCVRNGSGVWLKAFWSVSGSVLESMWTAFGQLSGVVRQLKGSPLFMLVSCTGELG